MQVRKSTNKMLKWIKKKFEKSDINLSQKETRLEQIKKILIKE